MKKYSFFLIVLMILGFSINKTHAQLIRKQLKKSDTTGYISVSGIVELNNKPLENSTITLYENNTKIKELNTIANGNFKLKLDFDKHYSMEITKPGLVVKKFEFNTHLPDSTDNHLIFPFTFTIVLFPKYKDLDISILDKPLAIINYSKQFNDFFYDYNYSKLMNEKVLDLQKKVEEFSNKYFRNIEDADKKFDLKLYKEALKNYKLALEIFPDELYPQERIKEINKLLKKQK
jgi:hypothetical protein